MWEYIDSDEKTVQKQICVFSYKTLNDITYQEGAQSVIRMSFKTLQKVMNVNKVKDVQGIKDGKQELWKKDVSAAAVLANTFYELAEGLIPHWMPFLQIKKTHTFNKSRKADIKKGEAVLNIGCANPCCAPTRIEKRDGIPWIVQSKKKRNWLMQVTWRFPDILHCLESSISPNVQPEDLVVDTYIKYKDCCQHLGIYGVFRFSINECNGD